MRNSEVVRKIWLNNERECLEKRKQAALSDGAKRPQTRGHRWAVAWDGAAADAVAEWRDGCPGVLPGEGRLPEAPLSDSLVVAPNNAGEERQTAVP